MRVKDPQQNRGQKVLRGVLLAPVNPEFQPYHAGYQRVHHESSRTRFVSISADTMKDITPMIRDTVNGQPGNGANIAWLTAAFGIEDAVIQYDTQMCLINRIDRDYSSLGLS